MVPEDGITHALMNGGHHATAVATAADHAARLGHDMPDPTPGSLSVYGALLLRGAVAAAQDDDRATADQLLAEAEEAAHQLGRDANHCWTAFGPVNTTLHRVSIAVTLGDAGTAIDLARELAATAPPTVRRAAAQFAASIGDAP
jgi:nucleotide-binding universal stress UspA family protein